MMLAMLSTALDDVRYENFHVASGFAMVCGVLIDQMADWDSSQQRDRWMDDATKPEKIEQVIVSMFTAIAMTRTVGLPPDYEYPDLDYLRAAAASWKWWVTNNFSVEGMEHVARDGIAVHKAMLKA